MKNEEEFEIAEYSNPPMQLLVRIGMTIKVPTVTWAVTVGLLAGVIVYLLVYIAGGF